MSQFPLYSHKFQATSERFDIGTFPAFHCREWDESQVLSWLKGIDDCVLPYVRALRNAKLTGNSLLILDDSELRQLGISSPFVRTKILHAISLLVHYCDGVHDENLQRIAMQVSVDVNNLIRAISVASPVITKFNQGSDHLAGPRLAEVLNSVLMSFSSVYEHVKKLVFWLDRAPFENQKSYVQIRDRITDLIMDMLESVNPQASKLSSVSEVLYDRGLKLQDICQDLVFSDDPVTVYTANFAIAYIRSSEFKPFSGITFQSVFSGVNLITSIEPESPAAKCKKLSAGDEILEINGEPVVGWNYIKAREKLREANLKQDSGLDQRSCDVRLLVCRRPQEDFASGGISKSKTSEALINDEDEESKRRVELDFSLKIQPDMFAGKENSRRTLHRRRSSSFTLMGDGSNRKNPDRLSMPVLNPSSLASSRLVGSGDKRLLYRRASVWSDSPPASFAAASRKIQNGLESKALMHLLDCWKDPGNRPNGHLRLVRASRVAKAMGTSRLTDGNHDVAEEDENQDCVDEMKADRVDYTKVDLVLPTEAEKLKLLAPSLNDPEWSAPVQEITGLQLVRRLHLESTSSVAPDSPLSAAFTKITRFWNGDTGSTSAMSTSYTSDFSVPSTPVTKNALEKIAKEKSRQTIPVAPPHNGLPNALTKGPSPESSSSGLSSPRYCTIKSKHQLAPLAEPENDDDDADDPVGQDESAAVPGDAHAGFHADHKQCGPLSTENKNIEFDLLSFCQIPSQHLSDKVCEGWIRRQRLLTETENGRQRPSQWVKVWAAFVNNRVLLTYQNQFARSAELVIDVCKCYYTSGAVGLKTSKKYVFALTMDDRCLHFAPYTQDNFLEWTSKIIPFIRTASRNGTNNSSFCDSSPGAIIQTNGVPSKILTEEHAVLPLAVTASPVNTLPRQPRLITRVSRNSSLSSSPLADLSASFGSADDAKANTFR